MSNRVLLVFAFALLATIALPQVMMPGIKGKMMILEFSEVKKEVHLTKDQEKAINELLAKMQKDPSLAGGIDMHYMTRGIDTKVEELLDDQQKARLHELWLQFNGPIVLSEAAVAQPLGLSEETVASIKSISKECDRLTLDELMKASRGKKPDKKAFAAAMKDANAKILALLTADQVKQWETMLGKPFKFTTMKT